jgi:hypothetical protein
MAETRNAEGTSHEASKKDEETLETKAFRCKYRWQLGRKLQDLLVAFTRSNEIR